MIVNILLNIFVMAVLPRGNAKECAVTGVSCAS